MNEATTTTSLADDIRAASLAIVEPESAGPTAEESEALEALGTLTPARAELMLRAIRAGAPPKTLVALANATRMAAKPSIRLPARYGAMSRAKGWARLGTGSGVQWGEEEGVGYRVDTAGKWTVFSSDGYRRKETVRWQVQMVSVGDETWTVAN